MPVAHGPDFMAAVPDFQDFIRIMLRNPSRGEACGLYPFVIQDIKDPVQAPVHPILSQGQGFGHVDACLVQL